MGFVLKRGDRARFHGREREGRVHGMGGPRWRRSYDILVQLACGLHEAAGVQLAQ